MVESVVGILDPCSTCRAMASSVNSVKLSARQYHCRPGTNSGSKRLCTAGNGASPTWSNTGLPSVRIGLRDSSTFSADPVQHHTTPHTFLRWRCRSEEHKSELQAR